MLLSIAALIGIAFSGFVWQGAQREEVRQAEQARDAAVEKQNDLLRELEGLRSQVRTGAKGVQCLNVLPSWERELTSCRATLGRLQANGGIFQRIEALQRSSERLKQESNYIIRPGLSVNRKESLNEGEKSELEDLTRRDIQIHQQILDLQERLHCGN
ncbi:hypothetical protein QFW77_04950 [Luteimonas sp. RD2P54]|uniref:Uncharacterized protein n=1 Tax=Luteimonas endophytica TaxID=3042023 RepID=A0ABT6J690_9GAMM|nr:hypothetical protein [Luteimonas endophytica]MDH5822339.1 hypothetical protein [Luteimonas endophytica]